MLRLVTSIFRPGAAASSSASSGAASATREPGLPRTTRAGQVSSRTPSLRTRASTAATSCSRPTSGSAAPAAPPPPAPHLRGLATRRPGEGEPLAQQHRQVVLNQTLQVCGVGKALVGSAALVPDPGEQLRQPGLAVGCRCLDVRQPGQSRRQQVPGRRARQARTGTAPPLPSGSQPGPDNAGPARQLADTVGVVAAWAGIQVLSALSVPPRGALGQDRAVRRAGA